MNRGMEHERDLATGKPWAIYSVCPDQLPTSPDRVLLTSAIQEIARRVWLAREPAKRDALQGSECASISWETNRHHIAFDLADRLRHGRVSSTGRRVGGGRPLTLTREHWDGDGHMQVVATGVIDIETAPDVWMPHWVFLEANEVELLAATLESVARPVGPYINPEYAWPMRLEEMARLLLDNVKAIAGSTPASESAAAAAPPTPDLVKLVALLSADRLSPVQRDAVVERAAEWLVGVFAAENQRVAKKIYRQQAVTQFGEAVAGNVFNDVWKMATAKAPNRRSAGRIPKVR